MTQNEDTTANILLQLSSEARFNDGRSQNQQQEFFSASRPDSFGVGSSSHQQISASFDQVAPSRSVENAENSQTYSQPKSSDELIIVREVIARRAHLARRGQVMEKWRKVTELCNLNRQFSKKMSLKTIRTKFEYSLQSWQEIDRVQSRTSGVAGPEPSELDQLLERIHLDRKQDAEERSQEKDDERERALAKEKVGETVLDIAQNRTAPNVRRKMIREATEDIRNKYNKTVDSSTQVREEEKESDPEIIDVDISTPVERRVVDISDNTMVRTNVRDSLAERRKRRRVGYGNGSSPQSDLIQFGSMMQESDNQRASVEKQKIDLDRERLNFEREERQKERDFQREEREERAKNDREEREERAKNDRERHEREMKIRMNEIEVRERIDLEKSKQLLKFLGEQMNKK